MPDRRCGTCRYADFAYTKHKPPRIKEESRECRYKVAIPTLPYCVRLIEQRLWVWPNTGTTCPCWEPKEVAE